MAFGRQNPNACPHMSGSMEPKDLGNPAITASRELLEETCSGVYIPPHKMAQCPSVMIKKHKMLSCQTEERVISQWVSLVKCEGNATRISREDRISARFRVQYAWTVSILNANQTCPFLDPRHWREECWGSQVHSKFDRSSLHCRIHLVEKCVFIFFVLKFN